MDKHSLNYSQVLGKGCCQNIACNECDTEPPGCSYTFQRPSLPFTGFCVADTGLFWRPKTARNLQPSSKEPLADQTGLQKILVLNDLTYKKWLFFMIASSVFLVLSNLKMKRWKMVVHLFVPWPVVFCQPHFLISPIIAIVIAKFSSILDTFLSLVPEKDARLNLVIYL